MARIEAPDVGLGEHVDWMLHRPLMATGVGALSEAVYSNTELSLREREAARWVIAQLNSCRVCQSTGADGGDTEGIDTDFYDAVVDWRKAEELTDRERMAAEFAERFVIDHLAMDPAFFDRARLQFSDAEVADLVMCCGAFLGLGRMMAVLDVDPPDERLMV